MHRRLVWFAGGLGGLVLLAFAVALIGEPLRRSMERKINDRLQGYTATIGRVDFHPIGFSLDLEDATLVQDANPDPPVAQFPSLTASVQWKALLRGRVVADFQAILPGFERQVAAAASGRRAAARSD